MEAREIQKIFTIYQNGKFWNIFLPKNLANDLVLVKGVHLPIPLVGFANLAHMGAYQYMPSCFGKLSLSLKKKNMSPLPAPGGICMGADSPCFSRGHCSVLINPPRRNFPCPRACGFLPLHYSVTGLAMIGYMGDSY